MRRVALALGGALTLAVMAFAAPAAAAQETGNVYVVHGIPGTPVDVYVDGERAIDDFQPGTNQGPVPLPAGSREVAVFPADAADDSGSPVLSGSADVPAGGNATLVAHLSADGKPTLTPFVNDVGAVPAGQARVVVRHTAAAPAVDVLADPQVRRAAAARSPGVGRPAPARGPASACRPTPRRAGVGGPPAGPALCPLAAQTRCRRSGGF